MSILSTWFRFSSDQHDHETSSYTQDNLIKLPYETNSCKKYSRIGTAVELWNKIQN